MNYYIPEVNMKKLIKMILLCTVFALSFNELTGAADQEGPPDWPKHPNPQPPHR